MGLRMKPFEPKQYIRQLHGDYTNSLQGLWRLLEWFPIKRLSYKGDLTTTRV